MNTRQAAALRGRLSGCFPDSTVDVTPRQGGANIFIHHPDGYTQVMTGDEPGMVLRALLGRELRLITSADGDGMD